jgi:hypothetical protein
MRRRLDPLGVLYEEDNTRRTGEGKKERTEVRMRHPEKAQNRKLVRSVLLGDAADRVYCRSVF